MVNVSSLLPVSCLLPTTQIQRVVDSLWSTNGDFKVIRVFWLRLERSEIE